MKKLKFIPVIAIILAILVMSACAKLAPDKLKSTTVTIKAVGRSLNSKSIQSFTVITAYANIANVQIEENSGNNGENVGVGDNSTIEGNDTIEEGNDTISDHDTNENNHESGGNEGGENDGGGESNSGNINLPGPFSVDIANSTASLGQVNVFPGTFKKVNFVFQQAVNLNGSSITISGDYTDARGSVIPYTINSAFAKRVQMPIAEKGIIVTANSSVVIDIVFDVNAWLSGVDFASATVTNGQIIIDSSNNIALLNTFEANLTTYVEQEN